MFRFLFLLLFMPVSLLAQRGTISGQVVDKVSQEPLIGVNILLLNTTIGVASDVNGKFSLSNVPIGTYSLRVTYLGYEPRLLTDVVVQPSRPTVLQIELQETAVQSDEIIVTANPFEIPADAPLSFKTLSAEEVRRTPGGQGDISRSLLSLPGVIGGVDNRNDLLVRGGGPGENAYILDGIEIPQINHFPTQGATGGPLGLLNVDLIADTEFLTGGFPARYGDALSSMLSIKNRQGSPDGIAGDFTVSAADAGLNLDGTIGKKGNWIFSARRSYLQFLFDAIGLPFLPAYWDFQTKVEYDLNTNNRLTFVGIGAIDDLTLNPPDDPNDYEAREIADLIFDNDQWSYTNGLVWRHLFKNGFMNVALSRSMNEFRFQDDNKQNGTLLFKNVSQESEDKLRIDVDKKITRRITLGYGGGATRGRLAIDLFQKATAENNFPQDLSLSDELELAKTFAYVQSILRSKTGKSTATVGLRYDGNTFLDKHYISPRFSATTDLTDKLAANVAIGTFRQSPEYLSMSVKNQQGTYVNQSLPYLKANHFIGGFAYQARPALRLSAEGFYKTYSDYPVLLSDPRISLANLGGDFGFVGGEALSGVGKGRAYGFELFAQRKFVDKFYYLASYTFSNSEFTGQDGVYKPSNWDIRHSVSFTAGYKLGRKWELGAKWRYLSGAPFTPFDPVRSAQSYAINGRGVADYSRLNSERLPAYHRLDFRADRRFFFNKWNGVVYIGFQNVYNNDNISGYRYTEDPALPNKLRPSGGVTFLPNIGISVEF